MAVKTGDVVYFTYVKGNSLPATTQDNIIYFVEGSKQLYVGSTRISDANVIEAVKRNGTSLSIVNKAVDVTVPTKVSDLSNDSGFVTDNTTYTLTKSGSTITLTDSDGNTYDVTDSDTTYSAATANSDGLLTSTLFTKLSGIETGATKTIIDSSLSSSSENPVQNKVINTALGDKADKSTTLSGYGITNAYTKTEVDSLVSAVFRYKGTKSTYAQVAALTDMVTGDVWFVSEDNAEYAYNGITWEKLGPTIDLSSYLTSIVVAGQTLNPTNNTMTATQLKSALDLKNMAYKDVPIAYGTCGTAAGTATKAVTLTTSDSWELVAGALVCVKFTYTNTASNPKLKVGSTTAASILYDTAVITTTNKEKAGYANRYITYMYDGSQFVFVGWSTDADTSIEAATATPSDLGTAAVGSSSKYAREDHVHKKPTIADIGLSAGTGLSLSNSTMNLKTINTASTGTNYTANIYWGSTTPSSPTAGSIWLKPV